MATGSVPITAGTGTPIRVFFNAAVDSGAYQQVFSLAAPDGTPSPFDPDGTLQVSPEATSLFLDDYSGTLTAKWTTGGTAPTTATGVLTTSSATTASLISSVRTIGTFGLRAGSYLISSHHVRHEAAAVTNNTRAWGFGLLGTPTALVPVQNGAVFELWSGDGGLYATIYSAGARATAVALTRRTDAAYHKYEIYYRQSGVIFVIDGATVATIPYPNIAVADNLAALVVSANNTTSPSAGPVLNVSSASVRDQSGTNRSISDGANPWLQATVKPASTAANAADFGLVVHMHPSSTGNVSSVANSGAFGSGATAMGKLEDNAHASGDMGVAVWGVRSPATPTTPTSAAGDYGYMLLDTEGKLVVAGTADTAQSFQVISALTNTTTTQLRAAQAAGIRQYVTDLTISNAGTTACLVSILDGGTSIWGAWLAAGASLSTNFSTPIRTTAATALQAVLGATTTVYISATGYNGI